MEPPELFQFHFSHYNEKARWGLDYKGVPHVRRSLLPGPHGFRIRAMTGQTQVPVFRVDGRSIAGSARILAYLEEHHPEPALYPEDPSERARALEIQEWFDREVGPAARRALFWDLLQAGDFLARLACQGRGPATRLTYRAGFPLLARFLRYDMKIDERSAATGRDVTRDALRFVSETAGPEGYLVGGRFTVADLTAASLLLLVTFPPELQFRLPEPHPAPVRRWLDTWRDDPGTAWVRTVYARHRGKSAEIQP